MHKFLFSITCFAINASIIYCDNPTAYATAIIARTALSYTDSSSIRAAVEIAAQTSPEDSATLHSILTIIADHNKSHEYRVSPQIDYTSRPFQNTLANETLRIATLIRNHLHDQHTIIGPSADMNTSSLDSLITRASVFLIDNEMYAFSTVLPSEASTDIYNTTESVQDPFNLAEQSNHSEIQNPVQTT